MHLFYVYMSHFIILVADITPEVRRQMRLKLQAQLKSQPRAHNRAELHLLILNTDFVPTA